jgi:hypothetical protein
MLPVMLAFGATTIIVAIVFGALLIVVQVFRGVALKRVYKHRYEQKRRRDQEKRARAGSSQR